MRYTIIGIVIMLVSIAGCNSDLNATPTQFPLSTTIPTLSQTDITPIIAASSMASPTPACDGLLSTRIIVGELAQIMSDDPRPLNVRTGPSTEFRILGRFEVGDIFLILEGPVCSDNYTWYRVQGQLFIGWVAEGEIGKYYIEPYFSG